MNTLLDKISSYNLFNYLLPGVLFAALGERITDYKLIQSDIVVGLFVYYFIGLVISRIGSLVLAPLLSGIRFIQFAPYPDFVRASKADPIVPILSEQNNTYRTLSALILCLVALKLYEYVVCWLGMTATTSMTVFLGFLFVVFLLAHRKQTKFITDRIAQVPRDT